MSPRPVCIYVCGAPPAPVAAEHGRFSDWFGRLLAAHPVEVTAVDATAGEPPDPSGFAAIIISGSPSSVTEPEPWMEGATELVREAARAGTPLLGVCFGHQLVAAALGGGVRVNPLGWEIGSRTLELTEAGRGDPLFDGMSESIRVNFSHRDVVDPDALSAVPGARVLARNGKSAAQAFAVGDSIRCVQFHPEFTGAATRAYLRVRHDLIAADAAARGAPDEHPAALLETTADTPDGERVLHNFIRHWVL
ncbi:MAG TPA: gamma-glutamyl-gamma-aminobutyrate hydrolase family protein [Kofleriaceae bacterium]|nr:gamma-glutamyl-gamma-aminobutyrate hydrolase family protein [Kofleriaceae bacterium]